MKTNPWHLRIATIAAVAIAATLFACAAAQIPRDRITDPGEMLFNGYTSADIDCYRCHKGDATGSWRGPNLVELVPKLTDADIARAIHEGPGMMPSFQGKIDDQQIAAITAWLRGKAK
jgi:mono/diheme cytochrome c family protein